MQGGWKLRHMLNSKFGLPAILPWGLWWCPFLPRSRESVHVVVGTAISPTPDEDVDGFHARYLRHVEALYDVTKASTARAPLLRSGEPRRTEATFARSTRHLARQGHAQRRGKARRRAAKVRAGGAVNRRSYPKLPSPPRLLFDRRAYDGAAPPWMGGTINGWVYRYVSTRHRVTSRY
eukprot:CAMPEP_0181191640 /NCGR_PEP_ID=MMETSP1096-20121128/12844_1 /TAXON_ID=156174 ORGANISM="Chrysochromulina ericina, Strain CCMP281" /NCGR_SAMPLE_ID=MMETSP1096 /ASSEMBLY_ACC=CAM_ASM_000453 /LENGTH=177 /DNA_ID=CAMNT_0023280955 /DNA_START=24 /DNA_END=558 /DNA_ORIENTATION=+